jgi:hypothetical protein
MQQGSAEVSRLVEEWIARVRELQQERPLQLLAIIAATAFLAGMLVRYRSTTSHARRRFF